MRRTFEEWVTMMEKVESGRGVMSISKEYKIDYVLLRQKYFRYRKYGKSLLKSMKGKRFFPSEKESMVFAFINKGVPLSMFSLEYDVSLTSLRRWLGIVRSGGSLYEHKKRGRKPKEIMGRPKKKVALPLLPRAFGQGSTKPHQPMFFGHGENQKWATDITPLQRL